MNQIKLRPILILSIVAVVIMFLLQALTAMGYFGDTPVGQTGTYEEPLIIPAGYAFSIWSLIYLGLIILPVYQWFKRSQGSHLWRSFHGWYAANAVVNGLWLVCASYQWLWMTFGLIVFLLVALYKKNELLIQISETGEKVHYWFEQFVISIYFAWITLATALNVSAALTFYGWNGWGLSKITWSVVVLVVVGLLAKQISSRYRDIAFSGVVIWAFTALAVKQFEVTPIIFYVCIGVIIGFGFLIYRLYSNKPAL